MGAIKQEPKEAKDETLFGYEVFKSSNPKALRFKNIDFSGSTKNNVNQVLFHYDEKNKMLAGYALNIYNEQQTKKLIGLLNEICTPVFKRINLPKGSIEIDVEGNEVKPENTERKTYCVWENKITGLSYFLTETGFGENFVIELTVLKRSTQFGKEWITTKVLDWYKNEKSEPLP